MKIDENIEFPWQEQCKYCSKGLNTTYCNRNETFMQNLNKLADNDFHAGDVEFRCKYFCFDNYLWEKMHK